MIIRKKIQRKNKMTSKETLVQIGNKLYELNLVKTIKEPQELKSALDKYNIVLIKETQDG